MDLTDRSSHTMLDELATRLHGGLVRPGDAAYDEVRKVYNGMVDLHPVAIAECVDAADVVSCVDHARDHAVPLAVRGGGHNPSGLSVADGALVIDLHRLRQVAVEPSTRTVRVGGGCIWKDVDAATVEHGLVVPSGIASDTGVGGLTLGGGTGYHTRLLGLTIDSLLSAEVVLSDGSPVTASPSSHPDLFWALRGGGGNFGVVTSFEFRGHPVGEHGTIYAGPVFYELSEAAELFVWFRDRQPELPRDLNVWLGLVTVPGGDPFPPELWDRTMAVLVWCYDGPHDKVEAALAVTHEFGHPAMHAVLPMRFPDLNSMFDAIYPPGLQWYWRGDFFDEISDDAIAVHLHHASSPPSSRSTMHLYPIDGAAADVAPEATAFAYRGSSWNGVIVAVDDDPSRAPELAAWTKEYWAALHPTSTGGGYVNYLMDEPEDRVRASFGANYARLQEVKRAYDPDNLFHLNQNIPPT